jgi:hypothetical protein
VSIFQKICPSCAANVAVASDHCKCGHAFELAGDFEESADEQALRDEELYENYLSARTEQAIQAAQSAEIAMLEAPDNTDAVAALELAREVAKSMESDLAEQRAKVAAIRSRIVVKTPAPAKPVKPSAIPPLATEEPVRAQPKSRPPASSQNVSRATEPSTTHTEPEEVAAKQPLADSTKDQNQPARHTAAVQLKGAHKLQTALSALKQAKARETAPAAVTMPQAMATSEPQQAKQEPNIATPTAFRQVQAARAERVMENRQSADTKECPNCTSSIPRNTTKCRCGYAFATGSNEMPSLTLCTGDFTALRTSFLENQRR